MAILGSVCSPPFSLKPLLIFFSRVGLTDDVQALEFLECQDMLPNLALLVLDIVLARGCLPKDTSDNYRLCNGEQTSGMEGWR